jgi:hypothetical protein
MFGAATRTYEEWPNLLQGTHKILNLTTGGHRSPPNRRERALREHRETLWFDYHLRGIQNGADQLDEFRLAIRPSETARSIDEQYLWDAAVVDVYPQAAANPLRLYFGGGGALVGSAAAAGGGQDTFTSDNLTGYDIADYMNDLPSPEQVMQDIPLRGVEYRSQPFSEDVFLVGAPHARVQARSQDAEFLIHVALLDERPSGLTRYVAGGFRTVRGHSGGTVNLDVPIAVYGYRLKQGHRLVVRVENHAWHRPPMKTENGPSSMPTFLRALPVFEDFTVRVRRDGPGSWIELPVATLDDVRVGSALPKLLRGDPEDLESVVFSDARYAGWDFQMLAGFSGSSPGVSWNGNAIPLNLDGLTARVLGLGPFAPLPLMQGTLDSEGRAEAFLALGLLPTLPPAAQGLTLVAVLADGQGGVQVSDALELPID